MKTLDLAKATASLAVYARQLKKEPVILTSHGKPIAALFVITNADLETITLSTDRRFLPIIRRSRARYKARGGISSAQMRRRFGMRRNHGRR